MEQPILSHMPRNREAGSSLKPGGVSEFSHHLTALVCGNALRSNLGTGKVEGLEWLRFSPGKKPSMLSTVAN